MLSQGSLAAVAAAAAAPVTPTRVAGAKSTRFGTPLRARDSRSGALRLPRSDVAGRLVYCSRAGWRVPDAVEAAGGRHP
eukprot:32159-Prymnesium_polylepis.1